MKIKVKFLLITGIALLSLISCEKVAFIDFPDDKPKMVLNGIISPDYGLWLNASKSVSTTTLGVYSYSPVTNARIGYYQEETLITSITENYSGNYSETDFKPAVNNAYEIVVNAPGLPEASAFVTIPDRVEILDFDTISVVRNSDLNYPVNYQVDFFLNFSISDPDMVFNHYMLGVFYLENDGFRPLEAETEDINMNIYIKDGLEVLAWDDKNFDGQTTDFTVTFSKNFNKGTETEFLITLYSIEEEYFKYLKSYSQNFTVLNDDPLLFEAVQVFSNVDGGYGIIAAVSSSSVSFNYSF